jgi:hypothetical protein
MTTTTGAGGALHLDPLPDRLRRHVPPLPEDVLAMVDEEHGRWRQLHDRLIGLIAALIDVAADGRPVREVIEELLAGTKVSLDTLVDARIDPAEIAALLRAHGSVGTVTVDEAGTTTFRHACGSGQRYWREHPDTPTVAEAEVPGVPGGRPRYCARCMSTIAAHGRGQWTVDPPGSPEGHCTWTVGPRPDAD